MAPLNTRRHAGLARMGDPSHYSWCWIADSHRAFGNTRHTRTRQATPLYVGAPARNTSTDPPIGAGFVEPLGFNSPAPEAPLPAAGGQPPVGLQVGCARGLRDAASRLLRYDSLPVVLATRQRSIHACVRYRVLGTWLPLTPLPSHTLTLPFYPGHTALRPTVPGCIPPSSLHRAL